MKCIFDPCQRKHDTAFCGKNCPGYIEEKRGPNVFTSDGKCILFYGTQAQTTLVRGEGDTILSSPLDGTGDVQVHAFEDAPAIYRKALSQNKENGGGK